METLEDLVNKRKNGIKVRKLNGDGSNLIRKTLRDHGIEDIDSYVYPEEFDHDKNNFKNIECMIKLTDDIKHGSKVYTLVDSDVDGYTSSAMVVNYFKQRFPDNPIGMIIPDIKVHGIQANFDHIPSDCEDLILPDSSTNDYSALRKLKNDLNIYTVVLDHHDIENEIQADKYNIINNHWSNQFVNEHYTGVGIVFEALSYLDDHLYGGSPLACNFQDLFALGEIGDMEDVSDIWIRQTMTDAFDNLRNKFIVEYFKDDKEEPSPKHWAFSLIPKINATTRIGTHEDRQLLMKALTEDESETFDVVKKKKNHKTGKFDNHNIKQNIYEYVKDQIIKTKNKQDRTVKKALKDIDYLTTNNDPMNIALLPDKYNKGLSGLIANKLLGDTKKPSFVVMDKQNLFKGSMRTPMMYQHAKEDLSDIDGVEYVLGHENAAGIAFKKSMVDDVISKMSILFKKSNEYTYNVDEIYLNSIPNTNDCYEVWKNLSLFGGKVKEPLIAIIGLEVPKKNINIKNHLLRINMNGITLVQFTAAQDLIDGIQKGFNQTIVLDMVGTLGVNTWLNKEIPQIILDDIVLSDPIPQTSIPREELVF